MLRRCRQAVMEEVPAESPNQPEDEESTSSSTTAAAADTASNGEQPTAKATVPVNAAQLRDRTRKKRHTIKKLEKKLEVLHRQIKKFSEAEVSLDEMDSGTSAYMKEDLLKRKFVATWYELCEFVGISPEIEIVNDELSSGYSKTPYPEINRRVTRLIRRNEFPDHYDIVELIERSNTKHELGISVEEKAQLSRQVFKDVGKLLKAQRAKDFKAHFGSHLTDDALMTNDDPATSDAALLEVLKKSLKQGQEKLEQLCEGFVVKQDLEGEQEKAEQSEQSDSDEEEEQAEEEEGEDGGEGEGESEEEREAEGELEGEKDTKVVKSADGSGLMEADDGTEPSSSGADLEDIEEDQTSDEESDASLPPVSFSSHDPSGDKGDAGIPPLGVKREHTDVKTESLQPPKSKKVKLSPPVANGSKDKSSGNSSLTHTTVIVVDDDDSESDIIVLSD